MKTVAQVSKLTGVSVRTLHHYDEIGLLKPAKITEAGYRLYDNFSLQRLHAILLLKELQFPLKEIRAILDNPGFDPMEALQQQIELLELQKQHLENLISHAREIQKTGVISMDFSSFDTEKIDRYAEEAKKKWGQTPAYKEYESKTAGQSKAQLQETGDQLIDIFRRFGEIRHLSPASPEAQALVSQLQSFITDNYYTCTKQILSGLGQMYAAPGEMNENIDKAGGEGTGAFARDAITVYCK
ncbi:MAG: MerR family transcriptional regulator [Oscillospiraceae bacterium]|nr:MerR family transcriptional regulator [Oscillospiraceae bacterium]